MPMKSLGLIDPARLSLIPARFWRAHEFCFHLHDQMLGLLAEYEASGAHLLVTNGLAKALCGSDVAGREIDVLLFLKERGLVQYCQHHIVSHLVLGLTSDMLHFLYEALMCFEKRKFAVGFALLRKPLKENLLFLSWLLGDESDFIARFEKDNYTTLNRVMPERRLEIFGNAIDRLPCKDAFAPDLLEAVIFSKSHEKSFEPIWQRASHLITSHGSKLRTEDLNINFIFHDAGSDGLFEHLYWNLPYVLLYAIQVALECFARVLRTNEHTTSHLILSSMGCFECLFEKKPSQGVTATLAKHLRRFLKCIHCAASLRLTRSNAIDMYLQERLLCHKCGLASPFPLYWLFAQAKVTLPRRSDVAAILDESGDQG
jgi:hypothetical protein